MRKMYLVIFMVLLIGLGACGQTDNSANGNESNSDVIEFNLSHVLTEDSSFHATAAKFAELVDENTQGEVKIEIFPAGQLGGEVQSIQAARNGNQDIIMTGTPALTATAPEFLALDLPFLFDSLDEANDYLQGPGGDSLLEGLSDYDLVGLGFHSVLERNVFANKPVQSLDDFKNLNIRVVQSDGYINAYEALGAQPSPMAYSEVYLALQQGVIDAAEGTADTMVSDKFMEVSTHFNLTATHHYPVALIMSEKSWDLLNEEQQEIVITAAKDATQYGIEEHKRIEEESFEIMVENGLEIVEVDREPLKEATQDLRNQFLEKNPDIDDSLKELIE